MKSIRLKVCGIKTAKEAELILSTTVGFAGLNFIEGSPRRITIETALSIVNILKKSSIQTVALFRDQPLTLINDYAAKLNIDFVQLHGNESEVFAQNVIKPVIKAIALKESSIHDDVIEYISGYPAKFFVLDREEQGTGNMINLQTADRIISAYPDRIFLAGGLNPHNIEQALKVVNPYGIDIAGGVRTNNVLDIKKINVILRIISAD